MKKRTFSTKQMVGSFMAGALLFSGFSLAGAEGSKTLSAVSGTAAKLMLFLNGQEHSNQDGKYTNHGMAVPESIIHQGTVYVPVRMLADKMNEPVFWEGSTRSVSIGIPSVKLFNAKGKASGIATFKQVDDGVLVKISASGLTPGKHGFHVHENAIQSMDFKSAGGHFNPTHKHHGLEHPEGSHVGDMPNLMAGQDGTAEGEFKIQHATLEKGKATSILGRSLIIHAGEDDNMSDPAGNSGDRILGGNIPK
ncbi:superoxide dismutase family protein [Paenibacillus dakarensis]|uniref:superoxide dismutase family protein n=1 Tax=Paenibacillus dakarensis TaxID=1527293 RepID=UPI0006D52C71|nr:superoxide dismutase family protein [Paenibacillus dakarensis]